MIPLGPMNAPRRVRFSWKKFGLVLLVLTAAIAGLVIARMAMGWPAG